MLKVTLSDTVVDIINLPTALESIETFYDSALAAPMVINAVVRAEKMGYNAVVIGCFKTLAYTLNAS